MLQRPHFPGERAGFFFLILIFFCNDRKPQEKNFPFFHLKVSFFLSYFKNNFFSYNKSSLHLFLQNRKYREAKRISQRRKPQLTPQSKPLIMLFQEILSLLAPFPAFPLCSPLLLSFPPHPRSFPFFISFQIFSSTYKGIFI